MPRHIALLAPGWVALALVGATVAVAGAGSRELQLLPFLASVVLFGLPHGAVDHLVPGRMADRITLPQGMVLVGVGYAVAMAAYGLVWWAAPALAAVAFIAVTLLHWGQGDLYTLLRWADCAYYDRRLRRAVAVLLRGSMPMLVPLVGHPAAYGEVLGVFVTVVGGDAAALPPVGATPVRAGVVVLLAAGGLLTAWWGLRWAQRHGRWQPVATDLGELALLSVWFLTVPPILAVGVYFTMWHALRHLGRLAEVSPVTRPALAAGAWARAVGHMLWDALPLTAVSLVGFAAVWLLLPRGPTGAMSLLGFYLVGIAILTVPHVGVVTWMDRRQGIW
jgi:Brp/Blh family beta-carotene 15,15'-monooxygenase